MIDALFSDAVLKLCNVVVKIATVVRLCYFVLSATLQLFFIFRFMYL